VDVRSPEDADGRISLRQHRDELEAAIGVRVLVTAVAVALGVVDAVVIGLPEIPNSAYSGAIFSPSTARKESRRELRLAGHPQVPRGWVVEIKVSLKASARIFRVIRSQLARAAGFGLMAGL
jgi:hypothetical protein